MNTVFLLRQEMYWLFSIMQIIMNYYGTEQVHITEAIDVVEIYEQVANYFYPTQHFK